MESNVGEFEWEMVEDEMRPEHFKESIGRIRRLFTLKINIPYNLITAAIALYFGALLLRIKAIPFIRIPFISRVTGDSGINFIALSFFLFFLLLTVFTTFQTGIDLFHGPTRFFFVRIISAVVVYLLVVGTLLVAWSFFSDVVIYFILLILFFWLLFQVSFFFRGCKSMAFNFHHRRRSKLITLLTFLTAIIGTIIIWFLSNDLVGIWVQTRFSGVSIPRTRINVFGKSKIVTLASGAILIIFGVFSFFTFLRKKLLEFLLFWFYLLYHYGLLAMNLVRNIVLDPGASVGPVEDIGFELPVSAITDVSFAPPTRLLDLALLIITILWVVHSLAYQTTTTSIGTRLRWINDFSTTHFFFAMAIVYLAGLLFFNTTEFIIPGLPHASLKLIQAGIHLVMLAIGLIFVVGETLIWIISLPFRLLYWLLKRPWILAVLVIVGILLAIL